MLAAMLLVLGLQALGAVAQLEAWLRGTTAKVTTQLGLSRASSDAIVLVAADAETVAAWGPPPWPSSRLTELRAALAAGEPEQLVVLGHAPLFTIDASAAGSEHEPPLLGLDGRASSWTQPWSGGPWDGGTLALDPDSRLVELGRRSDVIPPVPTQLPIVWQTPASRLPTVPAHALAAGRVPTATFTGRVVAIGLTDPALVPPLATPLGPLSPAEVEAQALLGLVDGQVGPAGASPWAYVACMVWASGLTMAQRRGHAAVAVVVAAAGPMLVAWVAPALGLQAPPWLGVALAWSTGAVTLGCIGAVELATLLPGLGRLRARVVHQLAGSSVPTAAAQGRSGSAGADRQAGADLGGRRGFWPALAELGAQHGATLTGAPTPAWVLARPARGWRLVLRAWAGLDDAQARAALARAPLDLRRAPLRAAWLTGRPITTRGLLELDGLARAEPGQTWVVPLVAEATLVGVWLLHVPERVALDAATRTTCEALARPMAAAILRRQRRAGVELDPPTATASLTAIDAGVSLLRDEHVWALDLLEQLPVATLIATVWGELEHVDPRLRQRLACRCPGLFVADGPAPNLVDVLARLSGARRAEARAWLCEVVQHGTELELAVGPSPADPDTEGWLLAPLHCTAGPHTSGLEPGACAHVLLLARCRTSRSRRVTHAARRLAKATAPHPERRT